MLSKNRFDAKEYMDYMSEAFNKEDAFRKTFVEKFKSSVHTILLRDNKQPILPLGLHSLTEEYAYSIISTVNTVVEKDQYSPAFKLHDEIITLQKLINANRKHISDNRSLMVFKHVKQHVDTVFNGIEYLSPLGSRLLYANLQWLHINYMASLKPQNT